MELTFTLTQEEAQTMLNALVERPYKEVFQLVAKLQQQAQEQLKKKDE